ncbi:hypothetical protein [Hymenobacter terricola]|uniref:hypothetical protein n=1 Tax=Hymenobacter terricola TaxID=2819236 RepID=UPI001B30CECB|nr:hypothetical protein [Hymenobacter terricola]
MFNSPLFDTAIALITLYLFFSQLTLSLVELPAGFLNKRGRYLHDHLEKALGPAAHLGFYGAAAIKSLMTEPKEKNWMVGWVPVWPAYVSETLFAQTIINWVSEQAPAPPAGAAPPPAIEKFESGMSGLHGTPTDKDFQKLLQTLYNSAIATAPGNPAEQSQALQRNLETWFHEYGSRLSGWYKRDQRWPLFLTGLVVAVLADVDTVRLARFVADTSNSKARLALVEAGVLATQGAAPASGGYRPDGPPPADTAKDPGREVLKNAAAAAVLDFQKTLRAVPQVGLPLGPVRWIDYSIDTVYRQRPDTSKVTDPQTRKRIPNPHPRRDSVIVGYRWAPTADDFGLPGYAQRRQIDRRTGTVGHAGIGVAVATIGKMLGGWLLTAFAMMLGAPFWFDTLCRFVNIRNVGIKPPKADKKPKA